jgi:hypothetical protein
MQLPYTLFAPITILIIPSTEATAVELVMRAGTRIEAQTQAGTIAVIAGEKFARRFEWNGCSLDSAMSARPSRWYGSLGIYDLASRLFVVPGAGCSGISRPVVQEGQLHFASTELVNAWIARYKRMSPAGTVWTNDGLLIQWELRPERYQLNVSVWQLCVGGNKPVQLLGATDQAISVSRRSTHEDPGYGCSSVSEEVAAETQRTWTQFWQESDEWAARKK